MSPLTNDLSIRTSAAGLLLTILTLKTQLTRARSARQPRRGHPSAIETQPLSAAASAMMPAIDSTGASSMNQ
jgi:hypothetical protein